MIIVKLYFQRRDGFHFRGGGGSMKNDPGFPFSSDVGPLLYFIYLCRWSLMSSVLMTIDFLKLDDKFSVVVKFHS